jgi:hypothetical protein
MKALLSVFRMMHGFMPVRATEMVDTFQLAYWHVSDVTAHCHTGLPQGFSRVPYIRPLCTVFQRSVPNNYEQLLIKLIIL